MAVIDQRIEAAQKVLDQELKDHEANLEKEIEKLQQNHLILKSESLEKHVSSIFKI